MTLILQKYVLLRQNNFHGLKKTMWIFSRNFEKWQALRQIFRRYKILLLGFAALGAAAGGLLAGMCFPWSFYSYVSVFIYRKDLASHKMITPGNTANVTLGTSEDFWGEMFKQHRVKRRLDEFLRRQLVFSNYSYLTKKAQYNRDYCWVTLTIPGESKLSAEQTAEAVKTFCQTELPQILQCNCVAVTDHAVNNNAVVWNVALISSGGFLGGFVGLMTGFILLFVINSMDRSMRKLSDLEDILKTPLLGVFPHVGRSGRMSADLMSEHTFQQSIHTLQLNLNALLPHSGRAQVFMFSSVTGKEGKSSIVRALAQDIAAAGGRVLIICADYRGSSPAVPHTDNEQRKGLSDLLSGNVEWQECIEYNVCCNLDVIAPGRKPDDPATLLSQKRFEQFLLEVSGCYEYIFIDASSMQSGSDPLIIGRLSDAAILVGDYRRFQRARLELLLWRFQNANVRFCGMIVNHFPADRQRQTFARYQHFYTLNISGFPSANI